jgi:hypothetical protein
MQVVVVAVVVQPLVLEQAQVAQVVVEQVQLNLLTQLLVVQI